MCPSPERPIILKIQSQKKLRKIKLRIYLQNQKNKILELLWELRERRRSFLRREGKCTWMLLQEINKVLNRWKYVN